LVDASETLRDWWTPVDAAAWDARANQVAAQFNAFPYANAPGTNVNGTLTRDENVADLGGVELAWNALQAAQPGADAKAFYGGWARLWPQQMSADVAALQAATDVHAPGQWRTNGPLINQTSFATAFECKPPAKMVLAKDQQPIQVWGLAPAVETPEDPKAKSKK
jgi:putative endopeptidase